MTIGDGFQGTSTLQPFSPRWADPDLLEKTLVGGKALADKLEQLAIDGAGGANKYQRLIIGPRGSGKTHLLKVLHTRLWRNTALRDRLLIIYLLEDELGIASFRDFLVRLLRAILAWYPEKTEIARGLDELYDLSPSGQQRRALELLLEAAGTRDLLIIMENLGVTFDSKQGFGRKGQQALRDLVQQHPRFMLFASAQALIDGISEPNAPFYEFFHITHLTKLTFDQAVEFIRAIASAYGNLEVVKLLGTVERLGRVRAIYDFTGGNHRLLVTFYDFLSATSVSKLSDAFIEALKPLKPYYQEQMRSLSAQQQKIVQYLSMERTPKTVKEIARGCLATSNTVSSQMKALLDKGFVERIPQGRETYYEISEALFRICYQADLDHQGAPIRLFVDFLGNFYTAQELELRARGFDLLARTKNAEVSSHQIEAELYLKALLQYHPDQRLDVSHEITNPQEELKTFFHDLETHGGYDEIISFAKHLGESKDAAIALVEADAYVERGELSKACAVLQSAANKKPDDPNLRARLATMLFQIGDNEGAEICCLRALELDATNAAARKMLIAVLERNNRTSEALEHAKVLLNGSVVVKAEDLMLLGNLHDKLGHTIDAEDAWQRAARADPTNVKPHLALVRSLLATGRLVRALEESHAAAELDPGNVAAHSLVGVILESLGRNAEAESRYRTVLERAPKDALTLQCLGSLLMKVGRGKEGIKYLKTATSLGPNNADAWKALGDAHWALGESSKAEASYRRAAELRPDANSVSALSKFLIKAERLEEAEALLRTAIEHETEHFKSRFYLIDILNQTKRFSEVFEHVLVLQKLKPNNATIFQLGGSVALVTGDDVEAERQLRRAVELDGTLTDSRIRLGKLFIKTGRGKEGIAFLETATSLEPNNADAWKALGDAHWALGESSEAEASFRRAVELKSNADSVSALSEVLIKAERLEEAEALLRNAIEHEAEHSTCRLNLARILMQTQRFSEAVEQVLVVQKLQPDNRIKFLLGGLVALVTGDNVEAERQLRRAVELEGTLTDARYTEAVQMVSTALEQLAKVRTLRARGDVKAAAGDLAGAVADYEAILERDPNESETLFNLSIVLLKLGRVGDAADIMKKGVQAHSQRSHDSTVVVQGVHSNLTTLFSFCTRSQMATFLDPVLELLGREKLIGMFEQALSLTVFSFLREHKTQAEERFSDTSWVLENVVAKHVNVSVSILLLTVGLEFFKRGDRKALMKLSREERALFTKELGVEAI